MAALEEEFTLSTGVLGAGPEGFLGVEQSDKADQFLVTDSGRTLLFGKEEKSVKPNFTARVDGKFISLVSLSSDGCIYETLIPIYSSDTEKSQRLVRALMLKAIVSAGARNGTAITILDQDHIAVLGPPLPTSKECLSIWNIKFQTLQTSKELPQGTSGQLWYHGEILFMLHGKCLTVIPYKCEVSSLAGALGKLKPTQESGTHPMPHFVNWETCSGYELGSYSAEQSKTPRRKKIETNLQPEVPGSKQLLSIIKKFKERKLEIGLVRWLIGKGTYFTGLVTKFDPWDPFKVVPEEVAHWVECEDWSLAPKTHIKHVLIFLLMIFFLNHSNCLIFGLSLCPGLMEIALEHTDVQMLQLCLQQFPDIPESTTCACLKLFLSIGDDCLRDININMESVFDYSDTIHDEKKEMEEPAEIVQNGFSPEDSSCSKDGQQLNKKPEDAAKETVSFPVTSCPVAPKRAALLNAVLHSAYSETFLLPHLKDIPAKHITLFLQYLYFLYLKCSGDAAMTLPGVSPPTLSQIMDWICLLLDANFTVVLMIPEAKRLILNLYKFVKSQISVYSELNKIEVSFRELQKLNQDKSNRGLYSIEVLELF
nr:LOW QUALITY PROTEIN: nucleolar protein 11 [Peromyscus maniculatus bairdii]